MIGLDTNVIIRYLMQDDKTQCRRAEHLIESAIKKNESVYLCIVVLCEVVWVLNYHYKLNKEEIKQFLEMLLHAEHVEVENRELVLNAFNEYQKNPADFPDCLIGQANQFQGCRTTYSFDKKVGKLSTFTQL